MVNTLSGMNGLNGCFAASHFVRLSALRASKGAGFHPALLIIEVSRIIVHEAHQPDLVFDLSDAHGLASERGREIDFASANADATAAGNAYGAIVAFLFSLAAEASNSSGARRRSSIRGRRSRPTDAQRTQ
jgi:hypothetical protein